MSPAAVLLPCLMSVSSMARLPRQRSKTDPHRKPSGGARFGSADENKKLSWKCVEGCGACCKLDKGPCFPTPEEVFSNPSDVELYRSLIGPDGWCIHYEKSTRTCSIYSDRPYFCRVEPGIFKTLYGIEKNKFDKAACSCCRDTIKAVYGSNSKELDNFNCLLRRSGSG